MIMPMNEKREKPQFKKVLYQISNRWHQAAFECSRKKFNSNTPQ